MISNIFQLGAFHRVFFLSGRVVVFVFAFQIDSKGGVDIYHYISQQTCKKIPYKKRQTQKKNKQSSFSFCFKKQPKRIVFHRFSIVVFPPKKKYLATKKQNNGVTETPVLHGQVTRIFLAKLFQSWPRARRRGWRVTRLNSPFEKVKMASHSHLPLPWN